MAGMTDEYGLTAKQRRFAENVVNGMGIAEAYRNSYDAENMKPASVQKRAAELMVDGKIKGCLQALAAVKRQQSEALAVSDRDMLIRLLRKWSTGDESATSTQLRAAELLGKACGLYRDVVEDHRERPASLVAAELEAKLASMLGTSPSVRPRDDAQVPQEQLVPFEQVPTEQRVNALQ
jgi:phage terminase small subunit